MGRHPLNVVLARLTIGGIYSLIGLSAPQAAGSPIKLAVFPFELEDLSAGAAVTQGSAEDASQLARVTAEVRQRINASSRFRLVDTDPVEHTQPQNLHRCGGCEAPLALRLGADESLVGVVSRISRTEYQVTYTLRDAHTGAVLSVRQTDLRMGADYSWYRGADWLIETSLLSKP